MSMRHLLLSVLAFLFAIELLLALDAAYAASSVSKFSATASASIKADFQEIIKFSQAAASRHIAKGAKLMKEQKCYEANLALKATIDSLSRDSASVIDVAGRSSFSHPFQFRHQRESSLAPQASFAKAIGSLD